ncbi:hypothetical protein WNY58_04755 [Neptuniibacter pectenicola]|uniref:Uncharacterized protein n=1 Tax=Neptuniibacter pectenicola TaxID=1806669 RepID=A0ABU9TQB5_9GAMM
MDLKDFISETISSIIEGVKEAQDSYQDTDVLINPGNLMRNTNSVAENSVWDNSTNVYAQSIKFDVSVTVEENSGKKGSIKILGGILNAQAGGDAALSSAVANKVQFSVPIMLPVQNSKNKGSRTKGSVTTYE